MRAPDVDLLAKHRYVTLRYTVPERLELASRFVADALGLVRMYGQSAALPGDPTRYDVLVADLETAAGRIRAASSFLPDPEGDAA